MVHGSTNLLKSLVPRDYIASGAARCAAGGGDAGFEHSNVAANQVINITFGGTPPYNLSQTVYSPSGSNTTCGILPLTLVSPYYLWKVDTDYYRDHPTINLGRSLANGDSVVFMAVQLSEQNDKGDSPYYLSQNYTLSEDSTTSPTTSATPAQETSASALGKPFNVKWVALGLLTVVAGLAVM